MAATDLERLIVSLEASTVKYERALAKANGTTNSTMRRIETRVGQMGSRTGLALGKVFSGFAAGYAAKVAAELIDASIKIQNSLKIAGLSGQALKDTYDRLFASAQRNAAPFEALATLYGRVAQVQGELGISSEQLAKFADNVAISLRISGRSAEESKGALLQLSQALSSSIVRAEEFNSINEGALPILQAVAAGLTEAGGSVAKLRMLVIDGKVSNKAFFDAFEAGSVTLEEKVGQAQFTVSQGFIRLQNTLIDAAGKFNDATNASGILGTSLDGLAGFVEKVGKAFADHKDDINGFYKNIKKGAQNTAEFLKGKSDQITGDTVFFDPIKLEDIGNAWDNFWKSVNNQNGARNLNLDQTPGSLPVPNSGIATGTQFGGLPVPLTQGAVPVVVTNEPRPGDFRDPFDHPLLAGDEADLNRIRPTVTPVSLEDYPIKPDDDKKTKAEKEAEATAKYIEQLRFEESQIGKTELAQQILNNVREAGANATVEQQNEVAELTQKMYEEQQAIDYLQGLYESLGQAAQGAIQGIISALDDGKITLEEFGDIASNVLSQVGNFFLGQAFGNTSGNFQDILGTIFGGRRAGGGPVEAGKVYKVNENTPDSEYFAPTQDGVIIPKLPKGGAGGASGGGGNVFHIDARGAQRGVGEEIRQALENYDRYTLPGRVNKINKDPLARG